MQYTRRREACTPKGSHTDQMQKATPSNKIDDPLIYNLWKWHNCYTCQWFNTEQASPDSAVYLHLKDKNHSIKNSDENILDREDRWFERGVKKAIFVKLEQPSQRQGLSATHNTVLSSLAQQFRPNSHSDCNSHHLGGDSHCESNFTTVCEPVKCQRISSSWGIYLYECPNILNT